MGKFRTRVSKKGKTWKKGYCSSSNPETKTHRKLVKKGLFNEILGKSYLTKEAVDQHTALQSEKCLTLMDQDQATDGGTTVSSFHSYASNWTNCSNVSFKELTSKYKLDSAADKNMLAVLAAVTDMIKENGGNETSTEYFATLLTSLSTDNTDDTVMAVVSLLSLCIRNVPESVLQLKFSDASAILLEILNRYSSTECAYPLKGVLYCLSILLEMQEPFVWMNSSTLNVLQAILAFVAFSKPKVRKAAQQGIVSIMLNKKLSPDAYSLIAQHCCDLIESVSVGGITTTLHTLELIKEILPLFPSKHIKKTCEAVLKVLTLNNVLITSCGFRTLHNMFLKGTEDVTVVITARLINALYDYQPPLADSQPIQAWLAVLIEAHLHLSRFDLDLCAANLSKLFKTCTELYASGSIEVLVAATHAMQTVISQVITKATNEVKQCDCIACVIEAIQLCLSYKFQAVYKHVFHVISTLFSVVWIIVLMWIPTAEKGYHKDQST